VRLSIIVPALNEAHGITATLAELQSLRGRGHEVIVVDGGSVDGTAEVAASLADRVVVAPRGRARQMNAGAAAASGEALVFLHADTRLPAAADILVAEALRNHAWGRFDVRIEGRPRLLPIIAFLMNWRSRLTGIATGDMAMFARQPVFARVGGFPELPLMEDIAFSVRMKRISRPACLTARVVTSGRRWESSGVWRTVLLMWRLRLAYFFGASPDDLAGRYDSVG